MKKITSNVFSPVKHRYSLALREINCNNPSILDVGGYIERSQIVEEFFKDFEYKSVNVGSAWYKSVQPDYIYDGLNLPFADSSFDYVISVDTLEHVNQKDRPRFIKEIKRVSRKRAVIVTPFRLEGAVTDESYILSVCRRFNAEFVPSLAEHEAMGLPVIDFLKKITEENHGKIKYATVRKDYWALQTAMLWNSLALGEDSVYINRRLQAFQEQMLSAQPDPETPEEAYRCVLVFDKA